MRSVDLDPILLSMARHLGACKLLIQLHVGLFVVLIMGAPRLSRKILGLVAGLLYRFFVVFFVSLHTLML